MNTNELEMLRDQMLKHSPIKPIVAFTVNPPRCTIELYPRDIIEMCEATLWSNRIMEIHRQNPPTITTT